MRILEVKSVSNGTAARYVKFAQSNSPLVLFCDAFVVSFRMIRGVSKLSELHRILLRQPRDFRQLRARLRQTLL